jgi:hypothetical protein
MRAALMRAALMFCLTFAAGCAAMGSAYVFQQDLQGGVLALQGDEQKAVEDAHAKMAAHCGAGNYRVYLRETVVVGEEEYADSVSDYSETGERQREKSKEEHGAGEDTVVDEREEREGRASKSSVRGTREVREPRIHYACGSDSGSIPFGNPGPAGAPAPAGDPGTAGAVPAGPGADVPAGAPDPASEPDPAGEPDPQP